MAIRERLIKDMGRDDRSHEAADPFAEQHDLQEMRARLHRALISRMDLTRLNLLAPERLHAEVSRLAKEILAGENTPLSNLEREALISDVQNELFGLGPLEPLLADPIVTD